MQLLAGLSLCSEDSSWGVSYHGQPEPGLAWVGVGDLPPPLPLTAPYSRPYLPWGSGSRPYQRQTPSLSPRVLPLRPAEKAPSVAAGPLGRPAAWRVCGGHRQPIRLAEHSDHGHRQLSPEGRQGAGPPGLRHGLHPDGRHHQCESWRQPPAGAPCPAAHSGTPHVPSLGSSFFTLSGALTPCDLHPQVPGLPWELGAAALAQGHPSEMWTHSLALKRVFPNHTPRRRHSPSLSLSLLPS